MLAAVLVGGALEEVDRVCLEVRAPAAPHVETAKRERGEESAYAADGAACDRANVAAVAPTAKAMHE